MGYETSEPSVPGGKITRKNIVEIVAMLQHLRAGASNNQIKRELKVSRHAARACRQAKLYG
jgi:hypothetical protein